jgi:hypothetical protein
MIKHVRDVAQWSSIRDQVLRKGISIRQVVREESALHSRLGAPRALSAAWCYLRYAAWFDAFQSRVAFLPRRTVFGKGR